MTMTSERLEVARTIEAAPDAVFRVLCDPQGHVAIDSTGMLMDATGEPVTAAGDTFVVHMDREALNDYPLGRYDVTVTITTLVPDREIAFMPARVLLQDFTGVPAVVDLAAMREAVKKMGGNPKRINPLFPAELVIDHSVQVDNFGSVNAFGLNATLEFQRNAERYIFLRWGQTAFQNFKVVPPETGICHQVNLEYLARVVCAVPSGNRFEAYPDSLVGTDSHTTMVNALGVFGWGVGGIEAEAAMLGQPSSMLIPAVVGFKLHGKLPEGATATDLVLTVTEMLRKKGVVGRFVEFYGSGLSNLSVPDRATIANMAPEYGATMGFFPVDDETLRRTAYKIKRIAGDQRERCTAVVGQHAHIVRLHNFYLTHRVLNGPTGSTQFEYIPNSNIFQSSKKSVAVPGDSGITCDANSCGADNSADSAVQRQVIGALINRNF
jgi:hypothetical protein